MKRHLNLTISPDIPASIADFAERLPQSFGEGGEVIYNKRNVVSRFRIDVGSIPTIVVKRFRRPRIFQGIGILFRGTKARRAWVNALRLLKQGIDTPIPYCYADTTSAIGWPEYSYLITSDEPLPPIQTELERPVDFNTCLAKAFGRFIAMLHDKGILHHDLNSTNVRYDVSEGEYHFMLIDINRMTFLPEGDKPALGDCIDNMLRFTGRTDVLEAVATEYARVRGMDVPEFVAKIVAAKRQHDRWWRIRKRICHPFRR